MVSVHIQGSILVSVKSLQFSTQMGKDTRGFKLSFQWLEKNWETWVTCQAHDRGGQSPSALRGEFLSGRQSLTTILNYLGPCMGSFQMPVLTSLSLFEQTLPIQKSEILNLVKPQQSAQINSKFIMRKDLVIMMWFPSNYMVSFILAGREGGSEGSPILMCWSQTCRRLSGTCFLN